MEQKDLVMNMEFECNGNKGRIVKIEEDFFTILWVDTKQFYDYPYDKTLLKSMILTEKVTKKEKEKINNE
jgi:hypothetical protein